jgi:beta-glucosidase-like glycosyl hydrolase/CubicO group peptidase (beta-lactamase class C family)
MAPFRDPAANSGTSTPDEDWVRQVLNQLSLEERVGQLVMPAFRGLYFHNSSPEFEEIERQIRETHVGGFILFAGEVYESALLINRMQSITKVPLLIASDFERGANFRIRGTTSFPWNMAIGATRSEDQAYLQGQITAREARAIGVHWILAPVLDVNSNPANPTINIRSFGEDPALVACLGTAFVRGAQEAGVLATGKHFPGHGDTDVDSHLDLPLIPASRQRLEQVEFLPFKKAIDAGIGAIMTAHVAVPTLEPDPKTPATLSKHVLHEVLQQQLGFSGLVVTDSLTMAGLDRNYWTGDAAVRTIGAGADMLLDPPLPDVVIQALLDAVRFGKISEDRLNHSVEKILRVKAQLGLRTSSQVNLSNVSQVVNSPEHQRLAREMAEASVTLLRDSKPLLPLDVRKVRSAHACFILGRDPHEDTAFFQQELKARLENLSIDSISPADTNLSMDRAINKAKGSELIICAIFLKVVTGTGTMELPEILGTFLERLLQLDKPLVTVVLGSPYVLRQLKVTPGTCLCTFSNADVSQRAAVKALFGEIPIQGKAPISLPGIAQLYDGIQRPKLEMVLKTAPDTGGSTQPSEQVGGQNLRWRPMDTLLKDSIQKHVFPGVSLAVGYQGQLVYHEAFGRFEYSPKSPAVTTETLFDLASLTKVMSTTTLAMELFDQGLLDLEFPLSRFYRELEGGNKGNITVRHLLTHSSGLPGHLPFYKDTQGKTPFVQKILETPLDYEPGAKSVYSDLGIILLGDIIEKLTGKPLDTLAKEKIFDPLQLNHTLYNPPPQLRAKIAPTEMDPWRGRLVQGEVHDENAYAMGGVAGHAGLFSNTADVSVFCQMLLNGGVYDHYRMVKRSTLEAFVTRQNLPVGSSRALGWDTPSEGSSAGSLLSLHSFGHTGFTGTSLWIDPTRQLFIILLTNRVYPSRENNGISEVRRQVADLVVKIIEQ